MCIECQLISSKRETPIPLKIHGQHKKLWYHESNKYSNWQYLGTKYILVSIIISLSMEKESTPGDLQD
jgi:hypothetical protein